MHTKHTTWSFLGKVIDRTPKPGQIEAVLMKANHKQIGAFLVKKVKYRPYLSPFYDRTLRMNSMLPSQLRCFFMQLIVGLPPGFFDRADSTWADNDSKRSVGRKISQDGNRLEFRIPGTREVNRR